MISANSPGRHIELLHEKEMLKWVWDRITGKKLIFLYGLQKNTGKTTLLNVMIRSLELFAASESYAITSIGRDGENRDLIYGVEKPKIRFPENIIAVTAERTLENAEYSAEILKRTDIRTGLGNILIIRIKKSGNGILAGPSTVHDLQKCIRMLLEMNFHHLIIDGAFNRISPAGMEDDIALIPSCGADIADTPEAVEKILRFQINILQIPRIDEDRTPYFTFDAISKKKRKIFGVLSTSGWKFGAESSIHQLMAGKRTTTPYFSAIYISGVITMAVLGMFAHQGDSVSSIIRTVSSITSCIVADDPSRIKLSLDAYSALQKSGIEFRVRKPVDIIFIGANPRKITDPKHQGYNPEFFISTISSIIGIPVLDPVSQILSIPG